MSGKSFKKGTKEWKFLGFMIQTLSDGMSNTPSLFAEKPEGATAEQVFETVLELLDMEIIYLCEEDGHIVYHTRDWFQEHGRPLPKTAKKYRELFSGHYDDWE